MSTDSNQLKEAGNAAFKLNDYENAIKHYSAAIEAITSTQTNTAILPSLYSNRSLCYLKQNNIVDGFYDCYKGLDGLDTTHSMWIKLAARYATTSLSLSTNPTLLSTLGTNNETYPQRSADDLKATAVETLSSLLTHPDLMTTAGIAQQVADAINTYNLPLIAPKPTPAKKVAVKNSAQNTNNATPKPQTTMKIGPSFDVDNMTLADLQRLNASNQAVMQSNRQNNMPQQAQKKLQGVWGQGGGKSLAEMLSKDMEKNGGPLVVKSKDSFISTVQQSKNQIDGNSGVIADAEGNKGMGNDLGVVGGEIPLNKDVQNDQNDQNDQNGSNVSNQYAALNALATQSPNDYVPPHARTYTPDQLQLMVKHYNDAVQTPRTPGTQTQNGGQNTPSDRYFQNLGYIGFLANQDNLTQTDLTVTSPTTKQQWRNASMVPRDSEIPLSDFDTQSEGDDEEEDDEKKDEKKDENDSGVTENGPTEDQQNSTQTTQTLDQIDDSTTTPTTTDSTLATQPEDASKKKRNHLDFSRFDDLDDRDYDEEAYFKAQEAKEKRRLRQQKLKLAAQYHETKVTEFEKTKEMYRVNEGLGHVHDGCLAHVKPNRTDDQTNVLCWNDFGLLMLGTALTADQIKAKEAAAAEGEKEVDVPFELGGENDPKDEQKDLKTEPKQPLAAPTPTEPGVITKDIYSHYSWSVPSADASSLYNGTTEQLNVHPSPADLALVALWNTIKVAPKLQQSLSEVSILNNLGTYEVASLQFPRRLTTIMNAQLALKDERVQTGPNSDQIADQNGPNSDPSPQFYWFSTPTTSENTPTTTAPYCVAFIPFDILLQEQSDLELENYQIVNIIEALSASLQAPKSTILKKSQRPITISVKDGTKAFKLPKDMPIIGLGAGQFTNFSFPLIQTITQTQDNTAITQTAQSIQTTQLTPSIQNTTPIAISTPSSPHDFSHISREFSTPSVSITTPAAPITTPKTPLLGKFLPKHLPFSTVEPILFSTAPDRPDEPAVLLVQRKTNGFGDGGYRWGLPITHIDDADTIGFTSTRLIHSLFGALTEKWSLVDFVPSETQSNLPFTLPFNQTKTEFDKVDQKGQNTPQTGQNTPADDNTSTLNTLKLALPANAEDDHSYYKGFRAITFSHIYGKNHKQSQLPQENDQNGDQNNGQKSPTPLPPLTQLSPYWPSRTKPALVNYQWFTRAELVQLVEQTPNIVDPITNQLLLSIFDRFESHYDSTLHPLIKFEWEKPTLSPAQQHEIQKLQEEDAMAIHIPFGFGALLSIETMNKQK